MRKTTLRAVSFICAAALLMSAVFTGVVPLTVSAAVSAPENPQTVGGEIAATLFTAPVEATYNGSDTDILNSGTLSAVDFSAVQSSNRGLIEFDFYVSDAATLKTAMDSNSTKFKVIVYGNSGNVTAPKIPSAKIKNDGWNHIILAVSNFCESSGNSPWSAVDKVAVQFDGTKVGNGITFAMANFRGTQVTRLTEAKAGTLYSTQFPHDPKTKDIRIDTLGYTTATSGGTDGRIKNVVAFDLGGANSSAFSSLFGNGGYIEFDFYVDNYESFADMLATYPSYPFNFYFTSDSRTYTAANRATGSNNFPNANCYKYSFDKQITHEGWNHIVFKMVNGTDTSNAAAPQAKNSSPNTSGMRAYGIRVDSDGTTTDKQIIHPCAYDPFIITNIIVTKEASNLSSSEGYRVAPLYKEKSFTLGSTFSALTSQSQTTGIKSQDFNTADNVEFDFFVESYGALKKAMASNSITGINLLLSSNASTPTSNCIKCPFFDQVENSGWNHIVVPRSSWALSSPTESSIVSFALEFTGTGTANSTSQGNMKLKVANISGTVNSGNYTSCEVSKAGKSTTWGGQFNYVADRVYTAVGPVDISASKQIEFDIFIEDAVAFHSAFDSKALRFYIASGSARTANRRTYDFVNQVKRDGWNHIVLGIDSHISTDSTDKTSIKWIGLACFGSNLETSNPISATNIRIDNVCARKEIDIIPAYPENAAVKVSVMGKTKQWGDLFSWTQDRMYIDVNSIDLSAVKFIEFDIYIEDQAAFHTAFDSHALRFYVSSADNRNNNRRKYNFVDQITKDGWNHIALNRECRYSSDSTALGSIKHVGLTCDSNTGDANALKSVSVRIANICGSNAPAHPGYALVDLCTRLRNYETGSENDKKGVSNYTDFDGKQETVLNSDISACDQIEFDFYCASYPAFLSNISSHKLYFVLTTNGDSSHRARYQFTDQVTQNGWNHIVLNLDARDSISETPNFSNVSKFYFSFWGTSGSLPSKENPLFATNVCATVKEITDVMATRTDFISGKKGVEFDTSGNYSKELGKTVDISSAGMIEIGIYVLPDAVSSVSVKLMDTNGGYAVYTFGGLVAGWNRCAVRLNDITTNGSIDFTKVSDYAIISTANKKVIASSFYAASYVGGDANRDGSVNIKDFVRAKRYISGLTTEGNRVAMDLSGDDYDIGNQDLKSMRQLIIS